MVFSQKFVPGRWWLFKDMWIVCWSLGLGFISFFSFLLNDRLNRRKTHVCPWKMFFEGHYPDTVLSKCLSKQRTNECCLAFLHSSTEYGAFQKRTEWHTLLCSCQCLHTKEVTLCLIGSVAGQTNFCIHMLAQKARFKANTSTSRPKHQVNEYIFESDITSLIWLQRRKCEYDIFLRLTFVCAVSDKFDHCSVIFWGSGCVVNSNRGVVSERNGGILFNFVLSWDYIWEPSH